jgi:hypothetical protein
LQPAGQNPGRFFPAVEGLEIVGLEVEILGDCYFAEQQHVFLQGELGGAVEHAEEVFCQPAGNSVPGLVLGQGHH